MQGIVGGCHVLRPQFGRGTNRVKSAQRASFGDNKFDLVSKGDQACAIAEVYGVLHNPEGCGPIVVVFRGAFDGPDAGATDINRHNHVSLVKGVEHLGEWLTEFSALSWVEVFQGVWILIGTRGKVLVRRGVSSEES